jgi:glycosyltransferase involved in cell wall biosynthesis
MKKLLFIAPHLSTGGLPQYLTKKIELLKDEFNIYLVEWVDCTGGVLVVTKNKVTQLVDPKKFYTLDDDKQRLIDIINDIQPDIIHLEEIPEFFMDDNIAQQIYTQDRNYKIVETSHDSSYNTDNKKFYPDKFMFVSQWQINQYKDLDIPKVLVEYPIEYVERPNREEALKALGLDPNKKHILHVGLYTSRKNQSEFFEYAKSLPEYEFHSLGNRADNFRWYWEPLAQNTPSNLTWWNERTDVDKFYQAMDLFLFTSRGHENDKETMPLVIRESISSQIPVLIYNLPVYLNYFDKFERVNYLEFDNFNSNLQKIKDTLNPEEKQIDYSKEAYVVCTYPVTDAIIQTTKKCIESLKKHGRKIIISSHAPVPQELQEMVDYVIYDANNFLVKHTFYSQAWYGSPQYGSVINLRGEGNDRYHGGVCYTSFYNGAMLGKYFNHEKLYFVNYDYILKDESYIDNISNILDKKDTYFGFDVSAEGNCFTTYFFAAKASVMLDRLKEIKNEQEYTQCMIDCGSESNGIENMYYHLWKNYPNNYVETKEQFTKNIEEYFHFEDFSMVEYYTVLHTNISNHFCPWITISNNTESKLIHYTVIKNGELIIDRQLFANGKYHFWDLIKYTLNDKFTVTFDVKDSISGQDVVKHVFNLDKDYFENTLQNNGKFTWNLPADEYYKKHNIKLLHLVTEPETNEKEQRSIENLKSFCEHTGIVYDMKINKIWRELPPSEDCVRPQDIDWKPQSIGNGFGKLTPGHYGCYLAHKNAITDLDNQNYDFVLVFEGDTIIDSDFNELYESLFRFNRIANEQNLDLVGFGNPKETTNIRGPQVEDVYCDVIPFVPAQSYLIPQSKLENWYNKLMNEKWEAWDLWIMNIGRMKSGIADKVYTKHLPGFSLVDQVEKNKHNDNPLIFVD